MKCFADVCRLILDIWLKGLVIEADDNVPTISVPKGKYSTNEFRDPFASLVVIQRLISTFRLSEGRATRSSIRF